MVLLRGLIEFCEPRLDWMTWTDQIWFDKLGRDEKLIESRCELNEMELIYTIPSPIHTGADPLVFYWNSNWWLMDSLTDGSKFKHNLNGHFHFFPLPFPPSKNLMVNTFQNHFFLQIACLIALTTHHDTGGVRFWVLNFLFWAQELTFCKSRYIIYLPHVSSHPISHSSLSLPFACFPFLPHPFYGIAPTLRYIHTQIGCDRCLVETNLCWCWSAVCWSQVI